MKIELKGSSYNTASKTLQNDSPVVNPAFATLCAIVFLAVSNNTVFYNFHLYLLSIGLEGKDSGFLIGMYSFAAMLMYAFFAKYITRRNACLTIVAGMVLIMVCGFLYVPCTSFYAILAVRIVNGIGVFLLMASAVVMLVTIIPPQKTGQAFSLYSVFLLLPYAVMPALSEVIIRMLPSPVWLYPITSLGLIPAMACVPYLNRKSKQHGMEHGKTQTKERTVTFRQAVHAGVFVLLIVNFVYFLGFSGMFFLFKGLAVQRAYAHAGLFFTVDMLVMIAVRLIGGRLFDRVSSVVLVSGAFVVTALAFLVLQSQTDQHWMYITAALFGLGMGFAVPPLNSMMYRISAPAYRGFNANMMMLTMYLGTFFGPFLGAWAIETLGYGMFLYIASGLMLATALFYIARHPQRYLQQ